MPNHTIEATTSHAGNKNNIANCKIMLLFIKKVYILPEKKLSNRKILVSQNVSLSMYHNHVLIFSETITIDYINSKYNIQTN